MFKNKKTYVLTISLSITLFICFSLLFGFSYAKGLEIKPNKTYQSVRVERDDTLWSIAKENMNKEYYKITDYINEVKLINNLSNDTILAGDYIIIPIVN